MEEKAQVCHKTCDNEFFQKFKAFFSEFEQLPRCDKKMLLKAFVPKIVVHVDFRIEIKVNSAFYEGVEITCMVVKNGSDRKKMAGRFSVIRTFNSASIVD